MPGTSGAIRAGRVFVELFADDTKLARGLRAASAKLDGFAGRTAAHAAKLAGLGAVMAAPMLAAVQEAAKASEEMAKFEAVHGDLTDTAAKAAEDLAKRVGRSAADIRGSMSTLQSFLVGGDFDATQAQALTEKLAALSLDLAAFHDIADDDASGRILAALSGSSEVLDQFGINTKAAALNQELLNQGFAGGVAKATEYQKTLARVAIIERALAKQGAIGAAERESSSYTNRLKAIQGQLKDLRVTIGTELLPTAEQWLGRISEHISAAIEWAKQNRDLVKTYAKVTGGVLSAAGVLFGLSAAAKAASFAMSGVLSAGKALRYVFLALTGEIAATGTAAAGATGSLTAMKVASVAAKAALAGLVAVGVFKLTQELTGAADAMEKLNNEIKRGRELKGDLDALANKRLGRIDAAIEGAEGTEEERGLVADELKRERANQVGLINQEAVLEKTLDDQKKADTDRVTNVGRAHSLLLGPAAPLGDLASQALGKVAGETSQTVEQIRRELAEVRSKRRKNTERVNELDARLQAIDRKSKTISAPAVVMLPEEHEQNVRDLRTKRRRESATTVETAAEILKGVLPPIAAPLIEGGAAIAERMPLDDIRAMAAEQASKIADIVSRSQPQVEAMQERVMGTFSGSLLDRMSAAGPMKAMSDTAKNTKDLIDVGNDTVEAIRNLQMNWGS